MSRLTAIGLMSGTSYDGVDVALINTDGEDIGRLGPTGYRPYGEEERALLRRAIASATNLGGRADRPGILADAEALVTNAHAEAIEAFLAANGMAARDIAVVGFHGQTVAHQPERGLTVQLGDGRALAGRLGIPVVYDFRAADVAAGGQGAPVVSIFHRAMVRMIDRPHPVGVLNIGGVANVTFIDGDAGLIACDTGPGNALIDDFLRLRIGYPQDSDGRAARPAASTRPPSSVCSLTRSSRGRRRNRLTATPSAIGWPMRGIWPPRAPRTAPPRSRRSRPAAVARAVAVLPRRPASWIVAGGGTRNATLMTMLAERLAPVRIETANAVGWSADALEAQAFAYLAVRSLRGLPLTFPATTGAPRPLTGGVVARP